MRRHSLPFYGLVAVLTSVVWLAFGAWLLPWLRQGPPLAQRTEEAVAALPVAKLTRVVAPRWSGALPQPHLQSDLQRGQVLALEAGLAEVRFRSGATVVLQGPVRVRLTSPASAALESGRLAARVPEAARGFVVETETLRLIDLGTEFGLAYDGAGTAEVAVFEGAVQLQPRRAQAARPEPILLTTGESVRMEAAGTLTPASPSLEAQFIRRLPAEGQARDNLLVNGGFEFPLITEQGETVSVRGSDQNVPGWQQIQRTAEVRLHKLPASSSQRPEDRQELILGGGNQVGAAVAQFFGTEPGRQYRVRYDLGHYGSTDVNMQVQVTLRGQRQLAQEVGTHPGRMSFSRGLELVFTADSQVTEIEFRDVSASTNSVDLLLDNVEVQPLP